MIINKDTFTKEAVRIVEPEQDYDAEQVITRAAYEVAGQIFEEFMPAMSVQDITELRVIFKRICRNAIDWSRVNRKAHPREYADSIEYDAWPNPLKEEAL